MLQFIDRAVEAERLGMDGASFRVHHFARQVMSPFRCLPRSHLQDPEGNPIELWEPKTATASRHFRRHSPRTNHRDSPWVIWLASERLMRMQTNFCLLLLGFGALILFPPCEAQGRGATGTQELKPQVYAVLAQLMRGIMFPASNVIFAASRENPADVKSARDPSTSTDLLDSSYGQWEAVENSALAIAETANVLMLPGRKCSNGLDVPLKNPDWPQLIQGLREAAMTAYQAAQSRNRDKMVDAAATLNAACANCHDRYRVANDLVPRVEKASLADRCK